MLNNGFRGRCSEIRRTRVSYVLSQTADDVLGCSGSRPPRLLARALDAARTKARLAGATAFEALEGYGVSGQMHKTHTLSDDAPIMIVIIDREEPIEAFLRDAAELLVNVLVTVVDVQVVEL